MDIQFCRYHFSLMPIPGSTNSGNLIGCDVVDVVFSTTTLISDTMSVLRAVWKTLSSSQSTSMLPALIPVGDAVVLRQEQRAQHHEAVVDVAARDAEGEQPLAKPTSEI